MNCLCYNNLMSSNYGWNNGKMHTSWELEQFLKRLGLNMDDFDNYMDIISYLYNMELDHSNKGVLDDVGIDIENCITEIRRLNEK